MPPKKGASLEEAARNYFNKQGYYALRSVPYKFDGEDVTDIDVWLYGRQAASGRVRVIVDAKDKKSPKALERVLWTRGLQASTKSDRAIVATTDTTTKVARFARANSVSVITKQYLDDFSKSPKGINNRLSLEEFYNHINLYKNHKSDGNWIAKIESAKESLVSKNPFHSFNTSIAALNFFIERIDTRPLYDDQAFRCALLCASIACVSLDAAIEKFSFETPNRRYQLISDGVVFGDDDGKSSRNRINAILDVIRSSIPNGGNLAYQINTSLEKEFSKIRSDVLAEYFTDESNSFSLFNAARELEELAHHPMTNTKVEMSLETTGILAVFLDHLGAKRSAGIGRSFKEITSHPQLPLA